MNDDLISRKSLLKNIDEVIEQYSYEKDGVAVMDVLTCIRDMVSDMPAYDTDKVIEQLKDSSKIYCEEYKQRENNLYLLDAIDIVKKGGKE